MADQRHAVIIGVDDPGVDATLPALRYATKDARAVRDILCDSDIGTFDPRDVTLFAGPQAKAPEIKKVLHRIAIASAPSDVLLIYFAGHTMAPPWSLDTDPYLVTPDLRESMRSENPDAGLRMSFLRHDVLKRFAGTAVLILDCCRAGSLLSIPDRDVDMISIGGRGENGYCALLACSSDGVAREDTALGHGVLTYHLLRGLRGHAADRQGYVTFQSLSTYILEQGLDPAPGMSAQQWGSTTALTRPGPGVSGTGRQVTPSPPVITSLEGPLDRHATDIAALIARLSRSAREPSIVGSPAAGNRGSDTAVPASARVQYLRDAVGADAVALMECTADGLTVIDSTPRFDREDLQHLLYGRTGVPFPVDQN